MHFYFCMEAAAYEIYENKMHTKYSGFTVAYIVIACNSPSLWMFVVIACNSPSLWMFVPSYDFSHFPFFVSHCSEAITSVW